MFSDSKKSTVSEPARKLTESSSSSERCSQISSSAFVTPPQHGILNPPAEFANSYQLDIISALRGNEHDFLAKAAIADAIRAIQSDEDKMELINFLASEEHGAIALTLENNACKMFNCSPSELPLLLLSSSNEQTKKHLLSKLSELFAIAFCQSIPTLFAMLYPLQQFTPSFQLRRIILRHFRDRVLIRTLANFEFGRELFEEDTDGLERLLGHMFGLINVEFSDEFAGNESFDRIYANFFGMKGIGTAREKKGKANERVKVGRKVGIAAMSGNDQRRMDEQRKSMAFSTIEDPNSSGMCALIGSKSSSRTAKADIGRKERARTMPSKAVSFWDDQF